MSLFPLALNSVGNSNVNYARITQSSLTSQCQINSAYKTLSLPQVYIWATNNPSTFFFCHYFFILTLTYYNSSYSQTSRLVSVIRPSILQYELIKIISSCCLQVLYIASRKNRKKEKRKINRTKCVIGLLGDWPWCP